MNKITINQAGIMSFESATPDKINLPYSNDNLCFEAYNAFVNAANNMDAERANKVFGSSTVTTYLTLLPYRHKLLAGIKIIVQPTNGQRIEKIIPATLPLEQLRNIADRFFRLGALGLTEALRKHYTQQYQVYCETA